MAETEDLHVLIVGSGITGLALAQSFKKAGISYDVFEKNASRSDLFRTRDWGITIHWGSSLLSQCLPPHVMENLVTAQVNPALQYTDNEEVSMINTATGEYLKSVPLGRAGRFSHRKFRQLLTDGIDIKYNKHVEQVIPHPSGCRVTVRFTDGTKADGSLLVGADGGHSDVRRFLLGQDEEAVLKPLPLVMNNFFAQYEASKARFIMDKLHRFLDMGINPDGTFFALVPLDIPDPDHLETAKFQIFITFPGELSEEDSSSQNRLKMLKERTKNFVEPFRSAIQWLSADQEIRNDKMCFLEVQTWDNKSGRVTLAGDAAHPFPPHRGQGLNNCFQDASNLTQALLKVKAKDAALAEIISQYDEELCERSRAEMQMSVRQATMVHSWDDLMKSPLMTIGAKRVNSGPVH